MTPHAAWHMAPTMSAVLVAASRGLVAILVAMAVGEAIGIAPNSHLPRYQR